MAVSLRGWKYLNLTYNVFLGMSAVVLFILSGILLYRLFIYRHFIGINVEYPVILLIILGLTGCLVAWIGWRVSWAQHNFHVIAFGVLLTLLVVSEFACFVWAMVVSEQLDLEVKESINDYFNEVISQNDTYTMSRWDKIQSKMQCCGVGGPSDYRTSSMGVPWSCCGQGPLDAMAAPHTADCTSVYQRGCAKQIYEYTYQEVVRVAIVALVASLMQSVGIFLTFFSAAALVRRGKSPSRRRSARKSSSHLEANDSLMAPKY